MTKKLICPKRIFDLFKTRDEEKLGEARAMALEWIQANISELELGGEVILPDPETGEPISWTKTTEGGLLQ
jgi:hypothetical protein